MTGFLLKALRGEVKHPYDEEGYLDIHALYIYLQNVMQEQQPNLASEARHRFLLAWYPPEEAKNTLGVSGTGTIDLIDEIKEIITRSDKKAFDCALCKDTSLTDIKMEAVTSFFKKARVQQQSDFYPGMNELELLEQFGLMREGFLTNGTVLCFGKKPSKWIEGAVTRCISWEGNDRHDILNEDHFFRGSLLEQFESGIAFLQRNLRLRRVIRANGNVEELEVPDEALREALANALIHREYAHQTNFVQVELFDNRIEISSPGSLLDGLTVSQLGVEKWPPRRNPQIAYIFYLCGHVEETGTGIPRMQRKMREAGLPPPKFALSDGGPLVWFCGDLNRRWLDHPQDRGFHR